MSTNYLNLKVVDITKETSDAITIHFENPDKKEILYKAGQFLTLIVPIEGKKVRRAYSLCSTYHELPRLSVTVKRVPGGLMSNFLLDNIKIGQELEVLEPMGNFNITPDASAKRNIVLIGAGSGITPLISIGKAILKDEKSSNVRLIYGNRNEESVILKSELEKLSTEFGSRFLVDHVYSQPVQLGNEHSGRLNRSMIIKLLEKMDLPSDKVTQYYICGPDGMMEEAKEALRLLHVPDGNVFKESFVSKVAENVDVHGDVSLGEDDKIGSQTVTVLYEGSEYKIEVSPDKTILEAALDEDIDLPYSCQAGLCTACRGKCITGKVHLDEREGLSDAEINEGYILTCVGRPLTSDVVIEIG